MRMVRAGEQPVPERDAIDRGHETDRQTRKTRETGRDWIQPNKVWFRLNDLIPLR